MKLRLSVTNGWKPLFFCRGAKVGRQCSTEADHDNDRHPNLVCHGMPRSSQGISPSNISITTSDKVTHLDSDDQLVERGCPFHLPCQSSIQINHHIIRNEEASCEERHSKQCECQVSAILSAATVPCRPRLSVNGTQCTQKNRKTFWMQKSKKDN